MSSAFSIFGLISQVLGLLFTSAIIIGCIVYLLKKADINVILMLIGQGVIFLVSLIGVISRIINIITSSFGGFATYYINSIGWIIGGGLFAVGFLLMMIKMKNN